MRLFVLFFAACTGAPPSDSAATPSAPVSVPWSRERAPLSETSPGGYAWRRGIIHLHSPYSHDACDGDGLPGGAVNEPCLASLRAGLCATAMDYAMVTDHPAHAAEQEFADTLLARDGDEVVDGIATRMTCDGGHRVLLAPGIEDELMPIGLTGPVADTPEERDRLYNGTGEETIRAEIAAGALVLQAHTEGQDLDVLLQRQAWGLAGVEMFNLHAMVDPDNRPDLGLDPTGHIEAIAPFLADDGPEPDLVFLGFYQEQTVSIAKWDALNAVAPTVGAAGTDAHENALPMPMSDGERVDSYRRMMSWFSNVALVRGDGPADYREAIAAGRLFVAFEALGTPTGFHVGYGALEMGGTAALGEELVVTCPTLAASSPREGDAPEITATVFKDGAVWATGCGRHAVTEPGVYRVRVDIVPHHLAGFLGAEADTLVRAHPWLYSNALRIGL